MDLALNNLQRLIYHKTQPTNPPSSENEKPQPDEFISIFIIVVTKKFVLDFYFCVGLLVAIHL